MARRGSLEKVIEEKFGELAKIILSGLIQTAKDAIESRQAAMVGQLEEAQRQAGINPGFGGTVPPRTQAQHEAEVLAAAYTVLGVNAGDDEELVKSVFRAKAKHLHPDKSTGDTSAFQRLEAAYSIVMADLKRRRR